MIFNLLFDASMTTPTRNIKSYLLKAHHNSVYIQDYLLKPDANYPTAYKCGGCDKFCTPTREVLIEHIKYLHQPLQTSK